MREILFRGKDFSGVINHYWCFGSLDTIENDRTIIIYSDRFGNKCRIIVDPSTIGEYTGLKDKHGKMIFEGDIVKYTQKYELSGNVVMVGTVKWSECYAGWCVTNFTNGLADRFLTNAQCRIEVIGNKFDNPELLRSDTE